MPKPKYILKNKLDNLQIENESLKRKIELLEIMNNHKKEYIKKLEKDYDYLKNLYNIKNLY